MTDLRRRVARLEAVHIGTVAAGESATERWLREVCPVDLPPPTAEEQAEIDALFAALAALRLDQERAAR